MDEEHQRPASGHEMTDADVKPIVQFLLGLFALIALVLVGMTVFFNFLHRDLEETAPEVSPLFDTHQIPPEPKLQVHPAEELKEVHDWERERLHSYGWIDQTTGVFRIPIERAMQIVAESGLPARQETPATGDGGSAGGSH